MKKTENATKEIGDILDANGIFKLLAINEDEHTPHPFTITADHLKASEGNDGILTEDILSGHSCGAEDCELSYEEHTCKKTAMITIKRDTTQEEVRDMLLSISEDLDRHGVAKVALVQPEEGYQIL